MRILSRDCKSDRKREEKQICSFGKGDKIALVTPGSPIANDSLGDAIVNMKSLRFVPVLGTIIASKNDYLAGTDYIMDFKD